MFVYDIIVQEVTDMNFTGFEGNDTVKAALGAEKLSHAYLITGAEGSGKGTLARMLAKAMLCESGGEKPCGLCAHCRKAQRGIHPDIIYLEEKGRENREITVLQVRELITGMYTMPNEAERKVYIIDNAGKMNISAQNALLKILEEPPSYGALLLVEENPLLLLDTIRSRCVELSLVPPNGDMEREVSANGQNFISAFMSGGIRLMEFCVGMEKMDREALKDFIDEAYGLLIKELENTSLPNRRIMAAVDLFERLRGYAGANVSAGHIAGMILQLT